MPPIPIHKNSPISKSTAAAKAEAPSGPQTDPSPPNQQPVQAPPPTTTSAASNPAAYAPPPPQPGQPAVPAPTGTINQPINHFPPTRTTTLPDPEPNPDAPPPPQPAAIPSAPEYPLPPTQTQPQQPAAQQIPYPTAPPSQFTMPPPIANQAPTHSTSTYAPPTQSFQAQQQQPAAAAAGPDLSHPPGYQQDPRAAEMTPSQRAVQAEAAKQEGVFARFGEASASGAGAFRSNAAAPAGSPPVTGGGGFAGGSGSGNETGTSAQQVLNSGAEMGGAAWETAKKWMGGVAEKAAEMEGEVWKRVNRER